MVKFLFLFLSNKRSLFGGGPEVPWPTTPTTLENNPEEGLRDWRQVEADNLISGVQYILFPALMEITFCLGRREVCKSLAAWDNNNIDNTTDY